MALQERPFCTVKNLSPRGDRLDVSPIRPFCTVTRRSQSLARFILLCRVFSTAKNPAATSDNILTASGGVDS